MDETGPGACPLVGEGGGSVVVVLVVVNLPTAVLCNEFHSICYLLLKKEMLLFLHHVNTAQ